MYHFGEIYQGAGRAMPCTLNRGQDSMQQSLYTIVLGEASDALLWSGKTAQLKFGEQ